MSQWADMSCYVFLSLMFATDVFSAQRAAKAKGITSNTSNKWPLSGPFGLKPIIPGGTSWKMSHNWHSVMQVTTCAYSPDQRTYFVLYLAAPAVDVRFWLGSPLSVQICDTVIVTFIAFHSLVHAVHVIIDCMYVVLTSRDQTCDFAPPIQFAESAIFASARSV